ncbi:MAG: FecR domain-containing protein [Calditrichaeota bacterium]|nr:FecR domain-containing protein [Calditrichota bacterium]
MYKISTVIAVIVFLILVSFANQASKSSAKVKFLLGDVQLMRQGKTQWQKIRFNQNIYEGDRIRTSLNARVELAMPDGSVIKINENTMFDVKEIKTPENDRSDRMSFTLWVGSIFAKFQKIVEQRQSRTVESPSAVVAVRGTEFDMTVDQKQTTTVRVYEGRVAIRSKQVAGEVLVGTNQQSKVEPGKPPTPPAPFKSEEEKKTEEAAQGVLLKIDLKKFQFTDKALLAAGLPLRGKTIPGARIIVNGIPLTVAQNGLFRGRIPVQEGINELQVVAEFKGRRKEQTVRILVNTKKPKIKLARPLTSAFTNRRDYSLSGAVFDQTPGDRVKVFINDEMVTEAVGQGSFNRTIILNEGKNTIRVIAEDVSGNRTEHIEQIFLDTVKPVLTITEPAQPVFIRFEPPRPPDEKVKFGKEKFTQIIRGIVIDPEPSSGIKRILVNGQEIKPNNDGTFEAKVLLKRAVPGRRAENRLSFTVEDLAGNILRDNSRVIIIQ